MGLVMGECGSLPRTAITVFPTGDFAQEELPEDDADRLQRLQEIVGGHLEVVAIRGEKFLVACDEAKNGLHKINLVATTLAHECEAIMPHDYLAGNVVIVGKDLL